MRDELDIPMPRMAPAEPGYRVGRQREAIDPATRRLALIGGGIAGVLLLIGGAWSLTGHHATGIPVVQADSRPLRTKPANPGGMQIDGQNNSILSGAADGKESLAPPPEAPDPQALKDQAAQQLAARQAAAAVPPVAAAAPSAVPPQDARTAVQPVSASATPPPSSQVPVAALPEQPPPQTRPAAIRKVNAATPESALGGHAAVQLAALGSEQSALVEWQRLTHRMPDLLGGRAPSVQKTEAHGRTFYRLRTGGFSDIAEATQFCQEIRAKGAGCELARF